MSDYFLGLILFAFFGAIILSITPQGMSREYLKFLCGLCSIGCIIFPLVSFSFEGGAGRDSIESFFDVGEEYEENAVEIYNSFLDDTVKANVENDLKSRIVSELKADSEDLDVNIILDKNSDEIYIKCIKISFYPSGYVLDPRKVERICFSAFECECEFVYL